MAGRMTEPSFRIAVIKILEEKRREGKGRKGGQLPSFLPLDEFLKGHPDETYPHSDGNRDLLELISTVVV